MNTTTTEKNLKSTGKARVYFSNLNGVRALAALMVVISHIELHKVDFHVARIPHLTILNFGKTGVTIFFALSGFLITYLLLEEKRNFSAVNFKAFYVRRMLRIWPLYFLLVVVGFFIYPGTGATTGLWLSVFFMPNLAFCLQMLPEIFNPIWSIGTEEQFYIFHPHFFRIKNPKNILYAFLIFIALIWALQLSINNLNHENPVWKIFSQFFYYARFDNMMIGAAVAVIFHNTRHPSFKFKLQPLFDLMFKPYMQVILSIIFLGYVYLYLIHDIPHGDVPLAVISSLLIVNLCQAETSIYTINSKALDYIGQISYGIYLLHKYPLFLTLYLVHNYVPTMNMVMQNIIIYTVTIGCAIGLASLSYFGYEKPFLNIKKRFQKITQ
ncbi:acyltransferase family protein [Mucilaginibacter endophyticus]|uniref:acyltransferase family protein n=1 Tax=Mucilaginibacter endophyticus TaxID=2675003 RepID=UPI000E0DF500|nr:acyltransferase [Mucilaginibacter endophyticus]